MKYEIVNAVIKTSNVNPNTGKTSEYLLGTLMNVNCPYAATRQFVSFNETIVKKWKEILANPNATIPDSWKYVYGDFINWAPANCPNGFYKKYLTDGQRRQPNGILAPYKAGSYVLDSNSNPVVYSSITVFCQYYYDNDGIEGAPMEKKWLPHNSPEEVGQAIFNQQCVRIEVSASPLQPENAPVDNTVLP